MSVRHHWTDAQMRACVSALGERAARRLLSGTAPSWEEARDLARNVLADTEWMERMDTEEWTQNTPNPVAQFLSRIAREIRPDAQGCNSYHRAGACADWRSFEDVPESIRGTFMIKYPYFFELRALLGDEFADPERARKRARRESPERGDGKEEGVPNGVSGGPANITSVNGLTNGTAANGSSALSAISTEMHAGSSRHIAAESASPTASEVEALLAVAIPDIPPTPTEPSRAPPPLSTAPAAPAVALPTAQGPQAALKTPSAAPPATPPAVPTAAGPAAASTLVSAPTGGSGSAPATPAKPRLPAEQPVSTINAVVGNGVAMNGTGVNGSAGNGADNGTNVDGAAVGASADADNDTDMDSNSDSDTDSDSDSDIEFISFVPARGTSTSASGSTSVSATSNALASSSAGSNSRKRPRAESDDEEVEFVSAGTFLTTASDDVRKTRSVLTGTFVASGPPPEGWDSVNLLTIDSDEEEEDGEEEFNSSGLRRSRRVAALRRSDRAPRVNYAENAAGSDDEDEPFQSEGERLQPPTPSRVQPPRTQNAPPTASTAPTAIRRDKSEALLKRSGWIVDRKLSSGQRKAQFGKAHALRLKSIALQVVTVRSPVLCVPSSSGLPMPSDVASLFPMRSVDAVRVEWVDSKIPARAVPPLTYARAHHGISPHHRVLHFLIGYAMLTSWNFPPIIRQPQFLTGWVLIVRRNPEAALEEAMVIAAKFGATIVIMDFGTTWNNIHLPPHKHAFFMHKITKGPLNAAIGVHADMNGRQVVEMSLLCLMNLIDRHFMATLLSTSPYEPKKGIIVA